MYGMTEQDAGLREAMELLDICPDDTAEAVKRKYRRMVRLSHPDEDSGSEEAVRKVIAAYEALRRSGGRWQRLTAVQRRRMPRANPEAFCERTIYRAHDIFEEDSSIYAAGRGRYLWDPDMEEFRLFTRSVRLETLQILQEAEEAAGIREPDQLPQDGRRNAFLLRIFHLLMQEFIEPLPCLQKILGKEETAAAVISGSRLEQDRAFLCIMDGTRLYVQVPGAGRVPLSFDEDCMHYLFAMLMARDAAVVSVQTRKNSAVRQHGAKEHVPVTVRADITDMSEAGRPGCGKQLLEQAVRDYKDWLRPAAGDHSMSGV